MADDDVIDDAVVKIRPDLTGFRRQLDADTKAALAGFRVTAKIKLVADATGFNRSAKTELAKQAALKGKPEYKIKLVADASGFNRSVREALAGHRGTAGRVGGGGTDGNLVDMVLGDGDDDKRRIKQRFKSIEGTARTLAVDLNRSIQRKLDEQFLIPKDQSSITERGSSSRADAVQAEDRRRANEIEKARRDAERLTEIERRESERRSRIVERESDRRRDAFNKHREGPQLINFGGKGIKPLNLLYGSLVALTPALFAVATSAVQASTAFVALGAASIGAGLAIGGLVIGFQSIVQAWALRKTAQKEAATEAANASSVAVNNANAELDRQQAILSAERNLHDARKQSARDLEDLRQKVADLQNQEKEDTLTIAEKQADRAKTYRNFFASNLEKRRADQDVNNSINDRNQHRLQAKQAKTDLSDAVKTGVEKSDKVLDAKEQLRKARAADAEAKVAGAGAKTTSAAANLAAEIAKMSPAAQALYYWFDKNAEKLTGLRRIVEQGVLPPVLTLMNAITAKPKGGDSTLELFAKSAGKLGGIWTQTGANIAKQMNTSSFRKSFNIIQGENVKSFSAIGNGLVKLVDPLMKIFAAAAPLFTRWSKSFEGFATWLDKAVDKADKDGSLAKWFKDAGDEAAKWWQLTKNILGLVRNLMMAALPTGNDLVSRLRDFFGMLKEQTKAGSDGRAKIEKFFEFFKNLDYAKLGHLAASLVEMFTAVHAFKFVRANPFITAVGILLTTNPDLTIKVAEGIASAMTSIVDVITKHPEAAATALTILSAMRLAKSVGFKLALPAVDALKNALTGKFKFLDKFLGGGASAGVMNVTASVVNITGPVAGGTPLPATGVPTPAGTPAATPARVLPKGGAVGPVIPLPGSINNNADAKQVAKEISAARKANGGKLPPGFVPPSLKNLVAQNPYNLDRGTKDPKKPAAANSAPSPYNLPGADARKAAAVKAEAAAYASLRNKMQNFPTVVAANSAAWANGNKVLQEYIDKRKASVDTSVGYVRAQRGEAAAQQVANAEMNRSRATLSQVLQQYGWTKDAADQYARKVYTSRDAMVTAQGSAKDLGNALDTNATPKLKTAAANAKDLGVKLETIDGERKITVSMDGQTAVFASLKEALVYQRALQSGLTLAAAGQAITRDEAATKRGLYGHAATGGHIIGPGTATSDSIPTMLSNGEWVHPTDSVQYYGSDVMSAMQKREIPREAFQRRAQGGPVGAWKFPVDISKTMIPSLAGDAFGGAAVGDEKVAELAESTARALGASEKQMIALIEAGIVESGLRNINYGDQDSLGFLQQRAGWGSASARMNVATATRKFIDKAKRVDNPGLSAGQLAQAVQVSAFPEKYDEQLANAVATLNKFPPFLSGALTAGAAGATGKGVTPSTWQGQWALIQKQFPDEGLISAFRSGSRTLSGRLDRHSQGKAVDLAPNLAVVKWIYDNYGKTSFELINPWTQYNLYRGKPHKYSPAIEQQHGSTGQNRHIHWSSFAQGGPVRARKYDSGGGLPPGYTLAFNGTGHTETIRTHQQEAALNTGAVRIDKRDLMFMAQQLAMSTPTVAMDGRRVAEITNGYSYLPAGV